LRKELRALVDSCCHWPPAKGDGNASKMIAIKLSAPREHQVRKRTSAGNDA